MITPSLTVSDPAAAAIDVGSEHLHVSIAGGPPKVFGTTTGQLYDLRDWLNSQGVRTVAMEATGIYWLCPDPQAPAPPAATKRGGINTPQIQGLHGLLWRLCGGKDATTLPGVADHVLLQLLAEVGTDLGKHWRTEKHFTAWLGLAPGSRQSGKRRGSQKRGRNRAGRLFCVIARSVGRSVDKALGGFYRRLKGRRGGLVANLGLARKLAELFWRLMVHGVTYVEQGLKKYEEKVVQTEQHLLRKLARKYNLVLQPKAA